MIDVAVIDQTNQVKESEISDIIALLNFATTFFEFEKEIEMSMTFMDNANIQEINKKYRQKDMPTDVISFALEDESADDISLEKFLEADEQVPRNIGDIMISIERAKEQAVEYGHTYERELGFLALHGFLHLLGYDHMTKEDEAEMFSLQKEILDSYGLQR